MKQIKRTLKNSRLGWHFLPANKKLGYRDGRKVRVGQTLKCKAPYVSICISGMHASNSPSAALSFCKGLVMCRVEVAGDIQDHGCDDKFAGRKRRVLWMKTLPVSVLRKVLMSRYPGMNWPKANRSSRWVAGVISRHMSQGRNFPSLDANLLAWAKKNGHTR